MHFFKGSPVLRLESSGQRVGHETILSQVSARDAERTCSHISFDMIISTSVICPFVDNKRMIRGDVIIWLLPVGIGVL